MSKDLIIDVDVTVKEDNYGQPLVTEYVHYRLAMPYVAGEPRALAERAAGELTLRILEALSRVPVIDAHARAIKDVAADHVEMDRVLV